MELAEGSQAPVVVLWDVRVPVAAATYVGRSVSRMPEDTALKAGSLNDEALLVDQQARLPLWPIKLGLPVGSVRAGCSGRRERVDRVRLAGLARRTTCPRDQVRGKLTSVRQRAPDRAPKCVSGACGPRPPSHPGHFRRASRRDHVPVGLYPHHSLTDVPSELGTRSRGRKRHVRIDADDDFGVLLGLAHDLGIRR